jgi:hypothetical protein
MSISVIIGFKPHKGFAIPEEARMKFKEFTATFRNPIEKIACGGVQFQEPSGEVVIAGTVLKVEDTFCVIDINGTQYEIPTVEISDIETAFPPASGNAAAEESGKGASQKKGAAAKEEKEEKEAAGVPAGPQLAVMKVNRNALLCRRVPIQAATVAAVGTWVSITPPATKPAASPAG